MQILNSKAYYLRNYSFKKQTVSNTKSKHPKSESSREKRNKSDKQTSNVTNNSYLPRIDSDDRSSFTLRPESSIAKSENKTVSKDCTTIYQKQESILLKLLKKQREKRKKISKSLSNNCVVIENHPLGGVKPYSFQVMKPTDRYFHQMENVRLAEKLLLIQPTESIRRKPMQKFYEQHSLLKSKITKLSFHQSKQQQKLSKTKLLSRKKWID